MLRWGYWVEGWTAQACCDGVFGLADLVGFVLVGFVLVGLGSHVKLWSVLARMGEFGMRKVRQLGFGELRCVLAMRGAAWQLWMGLLSWVVMG